MQHTGPADQSELIALYGRRGFTVGTTQSVIGRLGKEVLQQHQICEK